uniref:TPT domain-containing protein n=1 Tax=Schistocephalus solidus TaxID=70667 RepID=A0A183TH58_SCHSO
LLMKFIFACIVRSIISLYRGEKRVEIPWSSYIRDVSPTGIASALDIGLSNWSFEFITVSLYTMTKSTTIIFVLLFAIICKLEKPTLSILLIVFCISVGLFLFTYQSTQFDGIGFILVLSASAVSGIRWTAAQKLTQKSKFGLGNPVDVIYHTQPWMALTLLPLSFYFEIMELLTSPLLFRTQVYLPLFRTLGLFMCGALLAFGLECSEIFVVCHASSLTLAIAGIFKEVITLYLAAAINGDVSNPVNKVGLIICLTGISIHIGLKFIKSKFFGGLVHVSGRYFLSTRFCGVLAYGTSLTHCGGTFVFVLCMSGNMWVPTTRTATPLYVSTLSHAFNRGFSLAKM